MLTRRGLMHEFALAVKKRRGWRCSDRSAHSRALQMFNDYGGQRGLWLDDALLACELAGEDPVSDDFVEAATAAEVTRLQGQLAELLERPGMASVRTDRRLRSAG